MQPDYQDFSNYLTENARQSLAHAGTIARGLGDAYIGTEHLLLGVLAQEGSLGGKVLEDGMDLPVELQIKTHGGIDQH